MKLSAEEALCALRALYRTAAYHNAATAEAGKYVKTFGIVPEWLIKMTENTRRWFVRHEGRTYETHAVTRADAVNNIRFRLYGETPADALGEFDAINPALIIIEAIGSVRRGLVAQTPRDLFGQKTISKADALARIRRMAM